MTSKYPDQAPSRELETRLRTLISGKQVSTCHLHRPNEIVIEFSDGTRLFVDSKSAIEISVTGGSE